MWMCESKILNGGSMRRAALLIAMFFPVLLESQSVSSSRAPGSDVITIPKMRADLEFLAGAALRGRLTDTPENTIALEWMAARFKWLGLEPMGANGTYFLPYNLSLGSLGSGQNELSIARGDQATRYDLTSGFYPHR